MQNELVLGGKINPYDEPNTKIEQSANLNSTFIASSAYIKGVFVGDLMLLSDLYMALCNAYEAIQLYHLFVP